MSNISIWHITESKRIVTIVANEEDKTFQGCIFRQDGKETYNRKAHTRTALSRLEKQPRSYASLDLSVNKRDIARRLLRVIDVKIHEQNERIEALSADTKKKSISADANELRMISNMSDADRRKFIEENLTEAEKASINSDKLRKFELGQRLRRALFDTGVYRVKRPDGSYLDGTWKQTHPGQPLPGVTKAEETIVSPEAEAEFINFMSTFMESMAAVGGAAPPVRNRPDIVEIPHVSSSALY